MVFASGDNQNEALHPELKVCWIFATGIGEIDHSINISVYPNPGNGVFTVSLPEIDLKGLQYAIINVNGQIVKSGKVVSDRFKIDLTGNSRGIYILRVFNNKGNWSKKVLLD